MAEIVNMPRLSDTMEEGVVAKWLKEKGDKVKEGDILAEIETDKATMEFESFYEGTLLHIGVEEGDGAPVDSLLAIIGEEGEDVEGLIKKANSESSGDEDSKDEDSDKENSEESDSGQDNQSDDDQKSDDDNLPKGVEVVTMPRLSDTMEEGTVATWLKSVGDEVEEGDILAEIETDKATMEFESFFAGQLLHIGIDEGESAPVDDVLAIIGPEGTDVDKVLSQIGNGAKSPKKSSDKKSDDKSESQDNDESQTHRQEKTGNKTSNSTDSK